MIKKHFFIIINSWTNIFVETTTLMHKELIYFQIEIFCHILNVVTVSFDQFNAFLLSKNIFLSINKSYWAQTVEHSAH